MHCRVAQIVILSAACLLAAKPHVWAQGAACPIRVESASDDNEAPRPEISISEITSSGFIQMPVSDQQQIADSIRQKITGRSVDVVTDEALERVRAEWQNRGYFKVAVSGEARILTSDPASQGIALNVHVTEGAQYNLSRITFEKNNRAISDVEVLRGLFPIKDGDIFSREKIAVGLMNLREAYGEVGYINFISVPTTEFDDENQSIALDIDFDEGKQFHVSSLKVRGLDEATREELLNDFPTKRGQIYNGRLLEQFLEKHSSIFKFSSDDPRNIEKRLDERAGTVAITLDARPCPAD